MSKLPEHFKTPLARARHLGAAHGGTHHFMLQRLTALSNIPVVIGFVLIAVHSFGAPYEAVRGVLFNPFIAGILALFTISVSLHMRLGMQVMIEDYIHTRVRKFALLALNTLYCALVAFICLFALLRINFGL